MTVIDFTHWTFGGGTGRRCTTCGLEVPEGFVPSVQLDGALLLECETCDTRRVEERERMIRMRMGKATAVDLACGDAAREWRLRVEAE